MYKPNTKPTTQAKRKYDCTNFATHTHDTAIIDFDTWQTHVTIFDATGNIINMWNYDTTDANDIINGLESLYLKINRIWD